MIGVRKIGWLFLIMCWALPMSAQEVRTNEKGEKIIVYPDGTWKYFHEATSDDPYGDGAGQKTQAEREQEQAILIAENLNAAAFQMEKYVLAMQEKRSLIAEDLGILEAQQAPGTQSKIETLRLRLDQLRQRENTARQLLTEIEELAGEAESAIYMKNRKRRRVLESIEESKKEIDRRIDELNGMEDVIRPDNIAARDELEYLQYDPKRDVMKNPPDQPCGYTFNGQDKFTGQWRVDVAPQILFTFTPRALRQYFRDREYMTCKAYLSSFEGGMTFLGLEFLIASNNAPSAFGGIQGGSILSIRLMNGETLQLVNSKTEKGTYNAIEDTYVYRVQYRLTSYLERALADSEVDMIRVIWKTGYEDYEIYELDFFRRQMECLEQAIDR